MMKKLMNQLTKLGAVNTASIMNLVMEPSAKSENALNFFVEIGEISTEDLQLFKRFVSENIELFRKLRYLDGAAYAEALEEAKSRFGEKDANFWNEVMRQF